MTTHAHTHTHTHTQQERARQRELQAQQQEEQRQQFRLKTQSLLQFKEEVPEAKPKASRKKVGEGGDGEGWDG